MNSIASGKHKHIKIIAMILVLAFVIIPQTGCGDKEPVSGSGTYLDTQCDITIYGMDKGEAEAIIDEAFDLISDEEQLLSKTIDGSDTDRINKAAGSPVKVSRDTAEVISRGLEMGRISGGDFDISVGRLTDLWDFKSENPQLPSEIDVSDAARTVGYKNIGLKGKIVTMADPTAKLDLGGIAKGYVADKTTALLEERGVSSAIINLGGNVVAIGSKPDGEPFVVGVERPYSDRTEIIGAVEAVDKTVVTSGVYERKFIVDGILYHHILDPRSGFPAETDLESVTIMADKGNSAFCDGLSTTCLIKGTEDAKALIARMQKEHPDMNIEAAFIDNNDKITTTDGMEILKQ